MNAICWTLIHSLWIGMIISLGRRAGNYGKRVKLRPNCVITCCAVCRYYLSFRQALLFTLSRSVPQKQYPPSALPLSLTLMALCACGRGEPEWRHPPQSKFVYIDAVAFLNRYAAVDFYGLAITLCIKKFEINERLVVYTTHSQL